MLPVTEEPGVHLRAHRFDLPAGGGEAGPTDAPQRVGLHPLGALAARSELALVQHPLGCQRLQCGSGDPGGEAPGVHHLLGIEGAPGTCPPRQQLLDGPGDRGQVRLRDPGRQGHTESVAQQPSILRGGEAGGTGDAHLDRAPGLKQFRDRTGRVHPGRGTLAYLLGGERAQAPQGVGKVLGAAQGPFLGQALQAPRDLLDHARIQQLTQAHGAQQLRQQ